MLYNLPTVKYHHSVLFGWFSESSKYVLSKFDSHVKQLRKCGNGKSFLVGTGTSQSNLRDGTQKEPKFELDNLGAGMPRRLRKGASPDETQRVPRDRSDWEDTARSGRDPQGNRWIDRRHGGTRPERPGRFPTGTNWKRGWNYRRPEGPPPSGAHHGV
jgi:hypothetical protein